MSADSRVMHVVPPARKVLPMTLQDIVDGAPKRAGPDRHTVQQFFTTLLSMLAIAVLFGTAGGFALYWLLVRALAYLT